MVIGLLSCGLGAGEGGLGGRAFSIHHRVLSVAVVCHGNLLLPLSLAVALREVLLSHTIVRVCSFAAFQSAVLFYFVACD